MKKTFQSILIIFLASIIIMIPTMREEYYEGHDTLFHVANISALKEQISMKNLLAKEPLQNIANNFGYGTRLFYPPLPHLFAAYLSKICNNVHMGMRITQWLTFFLSGVTFYLLCNKLFKNKKISIIGSIFYMTTPYHLSEVFIRDAFSEMFIPIAIPLIVLGLLELLDKKNAKFFLYFILGYTISIYSHLAMTIYFTFLLIGTFFIIYFKRIFTKRNLFYLFLASIIILSLTSPFWLTLWDIKQSTSYAIFMPYYITGKGDLRFSAINPLIYLDFTLPHNYNFIRYHLHLIVTVLFGISTYKIIKEKLWKKKEYLFALLFTLASFIMTTRLFPWYYTPDILQTLQFPWRLCLYVAFGAIIVALILLKRIEKKPYINKLYIMIMVITLGGSLYYSYHVKEITVDWNNINYNLGMGNQEEYLPQKVIENYEYYQNRTNEILVKKETGTVNILANEVPNLVFEIKVETPTIVELPRLFYKGYILKKGNKEIELKESNTGFLEAEIKESGVYQLRYEGPTSYKIGKTLSLLTIMSILIYLLYYQTKVNKKMKM